MLNKVPFLKIVKMRGGASRRKREKASLGGVEIVWIRRAASHLRIVALHCRLQRLEAPEIDRKCLDLLPDFFAQLTTSRNRNQTQVFAFALVYFRECAW